MFVLLMFGSLILIIVFWNKLNDFKNIFIQMNIFLQSWNIYDGLVMDIFWTRNSKKLMIKGTEGIKYIPNIIEIIKKRILFIPIILIISFILSKILEYIL